MPDERLIQEIEKILSDVVALGGQRERTSIVPNMLVRDASPAGQDDYVIIADNRDNDNILALRVPGVVYADNNLVNVIFPEGGEAIAFQQGSGSTTSGLWDIVTGTDDIYYDKGDVGIGKSVAPDAALEILGTSQQQLRLTFQEDTKFANFTVDTSHNLTIDPSSTGQIKLAAADVTIEEDLIHEGDPDTKVTLTTDDVEIFAGNLSMLKLTEAAQDVVRFGPGSGDVDINFNGDMFLDGSNGAFGIGTSTIPHGGIGWAKLALDGANASSSGPHIQLTTASDDYPLLQMLGFSHDNVHLNFDSYWEGAWKSSDPGSNFKISKLSDQLVFSYDDGVAAGNTLGWNNGIIMDTDGHVGIGIDPVSGILQIAGTTSVGGEAALFFDADATGAGTEYGIRILGDASAKSGGSYLFLGIHGGVLGSYSKASIWIGNEASRPGINCGFSQTVLAPTHGAIFAGDVGLNGVSSPSTALDIGAGAMEFDEMTAPAAGAVNTARLFAQDNGAGKTQLAVRFNSGAIQILATEP